MKCDELIQIIERIIKDAQDQSRIEPPRIGPYMALEQIASELREFKGQDEDE